MVGRWLALHSLTVLMALSPVVLSMALAGCDSAPSIHTTYLERLGSALELEFEPMVVEPLTLFPASNTLVIERPAEKIDLLDFLQVTRCDMGALVGARNSSLGRVQSASQRWLYDTALVQGLRGCGELNPQLRALVERRQAELASAAFNALFTGKEWHAFATPPLATTGEPFDAATVERALLSLTAMVTAVSERSSAVVVMQSLEDDLANLRFSAALGEQRRAWAEQAATLETATQMLHQALEINPACRNGKPTPRGRIRQNVFEQFYVNALQPELARQGQADRGWVRAIATLVAEVLDANRSVAVNQSTPLPGQLLVVERWHKQVLGTHPQSEFGRWKAAIMAHSRAWQRQLGVCGLMPTLAVARTI